MSMDGKSIADAWRGVRIGVQPRARREPSERGAKVMGALGRFKEEVRTRLDAWTNEVTGFGTARDKTTYGYVVPNRVLADQELSSLYHHDDMAARMVDVVPQEMLREDFAVELGNPDDDSAVADKLESLDARGALGDGVRWGRCYGGSGVILGCDDGQDATKPLRPERAADLDYLHVVDRRFLWPTSWYDEPGPKLGRPRTFSVGVPGSYGWTQQDVHESRLVLFGGAPTGALERAQLGGWDLSVLQRAHDVLRSFNVGWKAVETLLTDANQAVFKMSALTDIISSPGGGEELLRQRVQAMDLYRSVMRAIIVDADGKESFERQSVSLTDVPATLDKLMLRLSSTVEVPVTILMGQSPAGMNATGDSDFRWFYDRIRSKQQRELTPPIRRIVKTFLATKAGRAAVKNAPRTLGVKYAPLWTETPLAQAQRELAVAQRDAVYINANVLQPDEVALHRFRPEGFQNEIVLRPEAEKARERALAQELENLAPTLPTAAAGADEAAPADAAPDLVLAPTDVAAVVSVNEARASVGLPPLPGPEGKLLIPEFKAAHAEDIAAAAQAESGVDPDAPPPPAPAFPFGPPHLAHPAPPPGVDPGQRPSPDEHAPPDKAPGDEQAPRFDAAPRTFTLYREVDETGVSGTGEVADGVLFGDGKAVLRWRTSTASTTMFDSVEDMIKVHEHAGATEIRWHDGGR